MPARRGRSKKDAVDRHAYDPAILHAKVIRLATDSAENGNASQVASKEIDADLVERLSKILDIAKQPGTSEDEAKCALRLIARMLSSDDEKKAEIMSLDIAQEEIQKGGHSIVQICRRDGKAIPVEEWIVRLEGAFETAFSVRSFFTGKGYQLSMKIFFFGLQTNVAAAALSFEAIFNLALVWAANHSSKRCYLLGLSSSIRRSAKEQIKLEEIRALESEKRLIEDLHRETLMQKKYQAPTPVSKESLAKSATISDGVEDDVIFMSIKQSFRSTKKLKGVKKESKDEDFLNIKQEQKDDSAHGASEKLAKFEQKLDEEIETTGWQNHAKLMAFREMAIRIADEYKDSKWNGWEMKAYESYRGDVQDFSAYKEGKKDAKKVDLKRRRLEGV